MLPLAVQKVLRALSGKAQALRRPAVQTASGTAAVAVQTVAGSGVDDQLLLDVQTRMREAGLKPTLSRVVVLQLLQAARIPVAFADLQRSLAQHQPPIPVNTAYMALRHLEQKALVQRLRVEGKPGAFYRVSGPAAFSQSLTCQCCGQHQWVDDEGVRQAIEALCQRQGVPLSRYRLEVLTHCTACSADAQP